MENKQQIFKSQLVNIFNREKIDITGVLEVVSSSEKEINLKLENANLQIFGNKLTILKLIPEEKLLSAVGVINGLNYVNKFTKKSFLGKVFK